MSLKTLHDLPFLGAGLGWRTQYRADCFWHRERLGPLELIAEEFLTRLDTAQEEIERLAASFPMLLHGIELSLGSEEPLDADYLERFARLTRMLHAPWVSEHLSFVRASGVEIGHLTPLPPTWDAVETVCRNVQAFQARVEVPVLLENITHLLDIPGEMTEWQFMTEILERSEAGLLLDVTNLYTNAINRGSDPWQELEEVPFASVVELHLAGGVQTPEYLADSHSAPIAEEVWALTAEVLRRATVHAIIIERDADFPPFAELLAEVERAQALWEATRHVAA